MKEFVEFLGLDTDGKYVCETFGIWKTIPDFFEKTWFGYKLTNEGWDYYEKNGLKHYGKGWVQIKFLDRGSIESRIITTKASIDALTKSLEKYNELISQ